MTSELLVLIISIGLRRKELMFTNEDGVMFRDVNESRSRRVSKNILGLEKKISRREISWPEICARTDVGIELSANRDAMSLFFASSWRPSLQRPIAVASGDAAGVWLPLPLCPIPVLPSVYLMPLIWLPPPPSLLGNYVTRSAIVCIASSFPRHCRLWQRIKLGLFC